ncbi:MAG: hypothetical protein ACXWZF_10530 [Actinomycetota bacterium]
MADGRRFASLAVWSVRIVALAIAVALLWWSGQLEREFQARAAAEFGPDWGLYWLIQAVYVVAGMAFAVAVRFPFPFPRFAWGRLLIAGIVILPVVQLWYAFAVTSGPDFLHRGYPWLEVARATWSILAGVAIGAGFGARRVADDTADEPSIG